MIMTLVVCPFKTQDVIYHVMIFFCSGSVVTTESYEKIIKKEMVDPINSKRLTEKDFIPFQRVSSYRFDPF